MAGLATVMMSEIVKESFVRAASQAKVGLCCRSLPRLQGA